MTGTPAYARMGGLRKPGRAILGSDIAGRVEAVGRAHTEFRQNFLELNTCVGDVVQAVEAGLAFFLE